MRGVERLGTIENLQSDVVALQPLTASSQRLINEVLQEPLPAMRLVERAAVENAVHLLTNGRLVGFAPVFELNYCHSPTPSALETVPAPPASELFHTVTY